MAALDFRPSSFFLPTYHTLTKNLKSFKDIHTYLHIHSYIHTLNPFILSNIAIHIINPKKSSLTRDITTTTSHIHFQYPLPHSYLKLSLFNSTSSWSQVTCGRITASLTSRSSSFHRSSHHDPATIPTPERRVSPSE